MNTIHRKHLLMAAAVMMTAGAAAVATAYPDDGRLHARNAATEQECAFDDRAQLDTFLANVEDADSWQVRPRPADATAGAVDLEQLRAELKADNPPADEPDESKAAADALTPAGATSDAPDGPTSTERVSGEASPVDEPAPAPTEAPAAAPVPAAPAAPKTRKNKTTA